MRQTAVRFAALLAAAFMTRCLPSFADADCYSQKDCPSDQVCELAAHICVPPPDSGEPPDLGVPDLGEGRPDAPDGGFRDAAEDAGTFYGAWRELSPPVEPEPREGAAVAYSPFDRALYLAGGCGDTNPTACSETWSWSNEWTRHDTPAPFDARRYAVLVESDAGPLVLFGGQDPATGAALSDSWRRSGNDWLVIQQARPPEARIAAAAAYDPLHRIIVMFGGFTCPLEQQGCRTLGDTCFFERLSWRCSELPGPSARGGHVMIFDATRGRVVMYGGRDEGGLLGDMWTFDGVVWEVGSPGPPARTAAAMAFDAIRGVGILFGGEGIGPVLLDDTWELHGDRWLEVETSSDAPARAGAAFGYDSGGGQLILFGGKNQGADTWEYLSRP